MYRDLSGGFLSTVNILLEAYALGVAPVLLVGAPPSDRIGRRSVMLPRCAYQRAESAVIALWPSSKLAMGFGTVLCGVGLGS